MKRREKTRHKKKNSFNLFNALCKYWTEKSFNSLHAGWLPFWNMQTTSRLYSVEMQQQLTPYHHAPHTGSLLSEPHQGRKKITSNTNHCVCTSNTRGKLWLPELGRGQARVLLWAKETKALPLWPWTYTKHGAELLNGGVTAEANHRCHLMK